MRKPTKTDGFFNFVIAGAGPAGLAAAIAAARKGLKAVVLEKGETAGPRPRGEGIRYFPLLGELLGKDYFENECFKMGGGAVYHSPGDLQQTTLTSKTPLYFFEWRSFIDKLYDTAADLGVDFRFKAEVLGPIEEENICTGLKYRDKEKREQRICGNVVLACDGHKSVLGGFYGVQYEQLNCAMVKCLISNANLDIKKTPDLQFYLIGNGDLEYARDFPPCVVYGFPIGEQKMEVGLMLRMSQAAKMRKTVNDPDNKAFFEVWKNLKQTYPGFSTYFEGAKIEHEEITGLSNVAMVENFMPKSGLVLIGDSAGFVDPFGSSGLYSGMAMADFWVDILADRLLDLSQGKPIDGPVDGLWNLQNVRSDTENFKKTVIYKQISGSYSLIGKFEWLIFRFLKTAKRINKGWKLISWLLKIP